MSKLGLLIGGTCALIIGFLAFRTYHNPEQSFMSVSTMAPSFESWHEFKAPSGLFTVAFPSLPQHATEKQGDPKTKEMRHYDMYVSEQDNGTIFMISMITSLENKPTQINEAVLSRVMNEMLAMNPQSKVKKMQMGKYQNNPAMDFSIENNEVNIDGKAFAKGNTLFVLTSVAKLGNYNRAEFDHFVNSFKFLEETPKKNNL